MVGNPLKTINCKSCGSAVAIRAQGRSLSVACVSCYSILDPNSEDHQILSRFDMSMRVYVPVIPLGTRGELRGQKLECVGFMVRSDKSGNYTWEEYLLYHPQNGFRWLVMQNGHCNFVTPLKSSPAKNALDLKFNSFSYNKEIFQKYTSEPAVVRFVMGEFYWAVEVGESVQAVDFIAPPKMLSFELSNHEIVASMGEYVPIEEVRDAFKLKDVPYPYGVAPNQPNPLSKDSGSIVLMSIVFFVGSLIIGSKYSMENAFTAWILLFGYVIIHFSRSNSIEMQRWENSDFAPSSYSKDYDYE